MFGDCEDDAALREAWHGFCDELKRADALVFRDTAPATPLDRAKGFRLLARNISLALQFQLDNADPSFPELMRYFEPTRKQGGDNGDALYVGAPIDGEHTYRIVGQRGSARYFAITVLENGDTPWGGAVVGTLFGEQIACDDEGHFEVALGPEPRPGDWIRTTPGTWRVTVRQFFADWDTEEPMTARIERVDSPECAPLLTPERVSRGLGDSAAWVRDSLHYWADMIDRWKARPGEFLSYRQLDDNAIDATPGGEPLICYWRVAPSEAMVIRVRPPECTYWNVEFGSYWWETMDYRTRHCGVNCHSGVLEEDGELVIVISHDDPGVPNWLDPSGHEEGYVTVRWIGGETAQVPQCRSVPRSALREALPESAARVAPGQREAALRTRKRGIARRFRA